jgi:hypothetical protein
VTTPIGIWPRVTPEILETLRAAKALIDTDVKIFPVDAVPDTGGVTLGFGSYPNWATDSIVIREENCTNVESVAAALKHWIDGGAPTYTAGDILSFWMGAPVEQIIDEFRLGNVEYALEQQRAMLR